jgi:hypothetical protein
MLSNVGAHGRAPLLGFINVVGAFYAVSQPG